MACAAWEGSYGYGARDAETMAAIFAGFEAGFTTCFTLEVLMSPLYSPCFDRADKAEPTTTADRCVVATHAARRDALRRHELP